MKEASELETDFVSIIATGIVAILLFFLMVCIVLALPYFFIRRVLKKNKYGKIIKMWGSDLRKRHTTRVEFHSLLRDMQQVKQIPNRSEYWSYCKHIYFATLHSRDVTLEQQRELYEKFNQLKVHGLPYPEDNEKENQGSVNDTF